MADVIRPSKERNILDLAKNLQDELHVYCKGAAGSGDNFYARTFANLADRADELVKLLESAPETLPPRITIMDDGRAMGGSDVCHTCEAHCTVINDLQTGLQKIIREGDYTAPEGMKRIAREALGLPQDAEPWRNCQMLACKPNRRCMNSDDCNTLKASESHGPVLTRVCPGCNTVHSGPLCPTESEGEDRG